MKKVLLVLWGFALAGGSLAASFSHSAAACNLRLVTDRPAAIYDCGDPVEFRVTATASNLPVAGVKIDYQLDHDGMPPTQTGSLTLTNGAGTITGVMRRPGFLSCRVTCTNLSSKPLTAVAAAGYEPQKLQPSLPAPADFDEFWDRQKARLRAVPMHPVWQPVMTTNAQFACFDVQVNCRTGRPMSGYFVRPQRARPHSLPAILSVQGAGVRSSLLSEALRNAEYGALALDINAHGLPNGQPDEYYRKIYLGELRDYQLQGRESREQCYFLGMFLREVRALDFLTSQPEWDGKHLIVIGGSQGGGQAIAAGGLDPRVTLICATIPALCDHSGPLIGRPSGWPHLVPLHDGQPDTNILQVARYFDGVNFAARVRADACFGIGFIDTVCPPSSSFTAYNALPGRKQVVTEPLMGHDGSLRIANAFIAAIKADIGTGPTTVR